MNIPSLQFFNSPVDCASFLVTPAVVITQGTCECCADGVHPSFLLQVQWLIWGFGVSIDFSS